MDMDGAIDHHVAWDVDEVAVGPHRPLQGSESIAGGSDQRVQMRFNDCGLFASAAG